MRVAGTIVKKRSYFDSEDKNINCILFIESDEEIVVNGDKIKIIPVLARGSAVSRNEGEHIEVDGEVVFKKIKTSLGHLSFCPIPAIKATYPETLGDGEVESKTV
ncbi:hypothetical protein ABS784_15520 [Geobacillus sp. G4]|uniref:hypothetical protein n=1 Tax=Geobacillus sp. G4 TaxID=3169691 RepID=UPI003336599F